MPVSGKASVCGCFSEQEGWLVRLSGRGRKDLMEIRTGTCTIFFVLVRRLDFIGNVLGVEAIEYKMLGIL